MATPLHRNFIAGNLDEGPVGSRIPVLNPARDTVISEIPDSPAEDVDRAVEAARQAQKAWAKLPPIQRAAIVERYYLGLSEAEMSERGASPPGTIKRRLHDARRGLLMVLRPQFLAAEAPVPPKGPPPVGVHPRAPKGGYRG